MVNDMFSGGPPPFWVTGLILTACAGVGVLGIWKAVECAIWLWKNISITIG